MKMYLSLILTFNLLGSELVLTGSYLKNKGYVKSTYSQIKTLQKDIVLERLKWPFEAPYKDGFIGNNFAQFQPYSPTPGYHGGADMILEKNSWVSAPVSGQLEAGHYGYENNPNGTATKWWKPWPASGEDAYFEVAVIAQNGLRYELHHLDRSTLTKEVINQLKSGNPKIEKGQQIAKVYSWSTFFHYHHVHLNVVDETGNHLNPESHFEIIEDNIAPTIKFLAVYENESIWINNKDVLDKAPESIAFIGHDKKNNNKFNQSALIYKIINSNEIIAQYDFKNSLKTGHGKVQDLRLVYPSKITLPNGNTLGHNTGYYPRGVDFVVKLDFKKSTFSKVYSLEVLDANNNKTKIEFSL